MTGHVLENKIKEYAIASTIDQENILQELIQLYVLASLSRAGFFSGERAVFHGGTCLRIVYGMNRFSEDLDFFLKQPDPNFEWQAYLISILHDSAREGFRFSVQDKSVKKDPVKKALVRAESLGDPSLLDLPFERDARKLLRVKLEVDTNPPFGSSFNTQYISFPQTAALTAQSLESGFGMKLGAILNRKYTKGRDWYDFIWYTQKKIAPDLELLSRALEQVGPWAGQKLQIGPEWVREILRKRIMGIDWESVRQDVQRFLPLWEQETLKLWNSEFFLHHLDIIAQNLML